MSKNLYYANERGAGMIAIIGVAGRKAHTVENNAYREPRDLPALVDQIATEFKVAGIHRFDTIDELTRFYTLPSFHPNPGVNLGELLALAAG